MVSSLLLFSLWLILGDGEILLAALILLRIFAGGSVGSFGFGVDDILISHAYIFSFACLLSSLNTNWLILIISK